MQNLMGALAEQVDFTRTIVVFALIMARVMAIVVLVPFLGGKNAPMEVKMGVGVTLTLLLWPTVLANLDPEAGLPLNPQGFGGLTPDLSFNTAVSFVTNTNW